MNDLKLLIICSELWPIRTNNANLICQLIGHLKQRHEVEVLSVSDHSFLSEDFDASSFPVKIHSTGDFQISGFRNYRNRLLSSFTDRGGLDDDSMARRLAFCCKQLRAGFPFDAVLVTVEPYAAAAALLYLKREIPCCVYLMDPTIYRDRPHSPIHYRAKTLGRILERARCVATTPFIRQALSSKGFEQYDKKILPVGFPLISPHAFASNPESGGKIRLLFCGWLYSGIRSPKYFLEILSRLDERFVVTFMGRECERLTERFDIHTGAELITLPQQPYEIALQAMAEADIMINIGNSVPVHMPSKTLEYINTGKPFVNFYKLKDCPTLYYTKRYPLCFNMSEDDPDLDRAAARFIDFCVSSKGKTVDRGLIEREFADCTPTYIANIILDALRS